MEWQAVKDGVWNWFELWGSVFYSVLSIILAVAAVTLTALAVIAGRKQGKIMEAQHQLAEQLRERRAQFILFIRGQHSVTGVSQSIQLGIENTGTKGADGLQWTVSIPSGTRNVHFMDSTGTRITGTTTRASDGNSYFTISQFKAGKIFPKTSEKLVTVSMPAGLKELRFLWRIACDDGVSPVDARGYGESKFIQMPNGRFSLSHPIEYGDK